MLAKPKFIFIAAFVTLAVIGFATGGLGKKYNDKKNYICCKGNQLLLHRFYTNNFFWVRFTSGYHIESINTVGKEGCTVVCDE